MRLATASSAMKAMIWSLPPQSGHARPSTAKTFFSRWAQGRRYVRVPVFAFGLGWASVCPLDPVGEPGDGSLERPTHIRSSRSSMRATLARSDSIPSSFLTFTSKSAAACAQSR